VSTNKFLIQSNVATAALQNIIKSLKNLITYGIQCFQKKITLFNSVSWGHASIPKV